MMAAKIQVVSIELVIGKPPTLKSSSPLMLLAKLLDAKIVCAATASTPTFKYFENPHLNINYTTHLFEQSVNTER